MKKILLVLSFFLVTGCKKQLVCSLDTVDEGYTTEQKIVFSFNNDEKVVDAGVNYTMTFEDEESAKSYLEVFKSLNEDYEINLDGKSIEIISSKNYENYEQNKDDLKKQLEQNGYLCK